MSRIKCWQRMKEFWTKILRKEENLSQNSFSFISRGSFSMEDCSFAIWEFYYKYSLSVLSVASTFWGWRWSKGKSRLLENLGNFAADHRWDLRKPTQEAVIIYNNGRKFPWRSLCPAWDTLGWQAQSTCLDLTHAININAFLPSVLVSQHLPFSASESCLQQALQHGLLPYISTRHKRPAWWYPSVMDNGYLCLGWDIWSQLGACCWADDWCSHWESAGHGQTSVWTQYCDESCSCLFYGFKGSPLMFKSTETLNEPMV